MLELGAMIFVSAIALTFFSDATSRAVKLVTPKRRRGGNIHVAHAEQSAI